MRSARLRSGFAGALLANSVPHLVAAARGREQLTPLRGPHSGPVANAVWAGMNLVGGTLLLRTAARVDRRALAVGVGCFAAFGTTYELLTRRKSAMPTLPADGPNGTGG